MTLMEMRFYPDFLTTAASTHVQSEPSILCNRLKSLILWQAALISAVTHAEICGRHPAPQRHENNQRSMESGGSSRIKCSAQRYNQYCFDWVVHFNKWLGEPQTNPSLVLNAFHLFYAAAEIAAQPQDFILTVLAVREALQLPKE